MRHITVIKSVLPTILIGRGIAAYDFLADSCSSGIAVQENFLKPETRPNPWIRTFDPTRPDPCRSDPCRGVAEIFRRRELKL